LISRYPVAAGDRDRHAPDPGALDGLDRAATDPRGVDQDGDPAVASQHSD
jgi:hypothetical protein